MWGDNEWEADNCTEQHGNTIEVIQSRFFMINSLGNSYYVLTAIRCGVGKNMNPSEENSIFMSYGLWLCEIARENAREYYEDYLL